MLLVRPIRRIILKKQGSKIDTVSSTVWRCRR